MTRAACSLALLMFATTCARQAQRPADHALASNRMARRDLPPHDFSSCAEVVDWAQKAAYATFGFEPSHSLRADPGCIANPLFAYAARVERRTLHEEWL